MVDIVMAVHNGEKYIKEAIESIIIQKNCDYKIIIVDDESNDNTINIVSRFSAVSILKSSRIGQAAALNIGIKSSNSKYLAFLDADDIWVSGKLFAQLEYLKENPQAKGVYGLTQSFLSDSDISTQKSILTDTGEISAALLLGSLLIPRDNFLKVGYFNASTEVNHLLDWNLRVNNLGIKFDMLNQVFLKRRIHKNNFTSVHREKLLRGYFNAIKNNLDSFRKE